MFVGLEPVDLEVGTAYGAGRVVGFVLASLTLCKSTGSSDKSALNRLEPGVTTGACVYLPVDEPVTVVSAAVLVFAADNNLDIVVIESPL